MAVKAKSNGATLDFESQLWAAASHWRGSDWNQRRRCDESD
jgi:hypothetical protein